ncbi:S9 family peptidase [Nocardiopsis lambiniae]|uniref:Prolyl oligopeptidase family serine peptidase n=1 Tax=Nocardiopsis lambiniae TaxID=3075539 RepID=A0ABU2M924_9ACTN|nr:prolyl oligopeptidase family serine peptidase [Nocardiopsis sp. DSM 44743]MDT0329164.1 prolyl oligopeptidase family serine peptidase [Nocardiopsis sp. DSM 44743]
MSFPRQQARTQRFTIGVPRSFEVSPDGRRVAFLRGRDGIDTATCLWVHEVEGGAERVVADPRALGADDENLPPEERARRERLRESGGGIVSYTVDRAFTRAVFTLSGRLFYVDLVGDHVEPRELPATAPVVDPRISPAGDRVAYVSGGALRVIDIADAEPDHGDRVLVSPDGENVTWGLADFVAAEEMGRYRGFWWAPDGSALLAARVDESPVTRWYVDDPAAPEQEPTTLRYPAAGTDNSEVRLAVLTVASSGDFARAGAPDPVWVEWDREALPYLATAGWTGGPDGSPTVIFTAQSRDQRTLTLFGADPVTGLAMETRTETDDVWVELMPGVPAHTDKGELVWIGREGGTGERRVFVGDRAIGPADVYVRGVVDVDGDRVLYSGSPAGDPGDISLWLADLGTGLTAPIELPGHGCSKSADAGAHSGLRSGRLRGDTLVAQHRSMDFPGVRTLVLRNASTETRRTHADIESFAETPELPEPRVEFWRAGERGIPCALVLPSWYREDLRPLPVLMAPYGGPHAQRVLNARGAFLSAQWYAEQGFAVLIADGRGTPGIGVEWEQEIHLDLATGVLEDQVTALRDAAERFGFLDTSRVGVHGWSFGGYLSALAVLRRPDVFHAAVAGAPVVDWRLYDTHYTERYLGLPQDDPGVYERSSLLEDAAKLERPLMLIHGLSDDNVVFAHTQRMSSALLAAGRGHTVLPLSGVTHSPSDPTVAENLMLLQVEFLKDALRGEG